MSRQESEDAVKALAKEKDLLEREKWELRRQAKEATDHASALHSQLDLKDNRMKELEAELAMVSWLINTHLSVCCSGVVAVHFHAQTNVSKSGKGGFSYTCDF